MAKRRKLLPHQIWLAKLAYFPQNPVHATVVRLYHVDKMGRVLFFDLESDAPGRVHSNVSMYHFELVRFIHTAGQIPEEDL